MNNANDRAGHHRDSRLATVGAIPRIFALFQSAASIKELSRVSKDPLVIEFYGFARIIAAYRSGEATICFAPTQGSSLNDNMAGHHVHAAGEGDVALF